MAKLTWFSCRITLLLALLFIPTSLRAGVHRLSKRMSSVETAFKDLNENTMINGNGNGGGDARPAMETCRSRSACGWAVYAPLTRSVEYFMENTCICPKGKSCQQFDDDISVGAYVFRCLNETVSGDARSELSHFFNMA